MSNSPLSTKITIDHVNHAFTIKDKTLPVLDNVQLTIQPGEFVALLGPSGCGKSTLLRLIAGLEQPNAGSIKEDETPITAPDPSRVVVFQDPTLYPWRTVYDNVALGLQIQRRPKDEIDAKVKSILERVNLTQFAQAWPHQLSGGMAQRVALARALINKPRLLVLDEPLGKLDSLTRLKMQKEIVDLWQEQQFSAIMVTHDVEEALYMANRVVVFSQRPAKILDIVQMNLPYPRHRDNPEFVALRSQILRLLGNDEQRQAA